MTETLPAKAKQDPIGFLKTERASAPGIRTLDDSLRSRARIQLVAAAAKLIGKEAEPVLRAALVARLVLERRFGQLLSKKDTRVIRDDSGQIVGWDPPLPDGISRNLSMHAQDLANAPDDWFENLTTAIEAGKERWAIKEIYLEAKRRAIQAETSTDGEVEESDALRVGDFRELGQGIEPESVALVFTDPPYSRDNIPLYGDVARMAEKVLLPGGSLVLYAPNYALPEVLDQMSGSLRYWWTIAVLHGGGQSLMQEYGVRVAFKPLLWFVKGGRFNKQNILVDVIESSQDKTVSEGVHEWQQSGIEARYVIEKLTEPGDLVVDPMVGSGTTAVAAKELGRRFVGFDIDADAIAMARKRLEE